MRFDARQVWPTGALVPGQYYALYCQKVVALMATGVGVLSFAKSVGVTKKVVARWAKEHPDFAEALEQAVAARGAYWERKLIDLAAAGKATTGAQWALKNIDPEEYRDKTEVQSTNLNMNVNRDANWQSIEEKFARIREVDGESNRLVEHRAADEIPRQLN